MEVKGRVLHVLPKTSGDGKNGSWEKIDFVIRYGDKYPKDACFQGFGKIVPVIDSLEEGEEVTVHFNPESREYQGKWYTNNACWKIGRVTGATPANTSAAAPDTSGAVTFSSDDDDSLPF